MLLFCYLGRFFAVNVVLFSLRFGFLVQNYVVFLGLELGWLRDVLCYIEFFVCYQGFCCPMLCSLVYSSVLLCQVKLCYVVVSGPVFHCPRDICFVKNMLCCPGLCVP